MDKKIPRQIDPVVMRMLEKDRDKRFGSMGEVIDAITTRETLFFRDESPF